MGVAWVALGRDPSTAWNKSLAQAKVRQPEFVPGIPGVPEPKREPFPVAKNPGFRVDDEIKVYLSNVAKLAPKTQRKSYMDHQSGRFAVIFRAEPFVNDAIPCSAKVCQFCCTRSPDEANVIFRCIQEGLEALFASLAGRGL